MLTCASPLPSISTPNSGADGVDGDRSEDTSSASPHAHLHIWGWGWALKHISANQRLSACTSASAPVLVAMRRFPNRDVEDWIGLGFRLGGTVEMGMIRGFDSPQKANSPRLNLLGEPAPKNEIQKANDVENKQTKRSEDETAPHACNL